VSSFGTRLRLEREQRGITLDQISRSTKIGTRFLQALEQDHFEQLPGGIFNKGFIRAYARFLGLNEEQTLADYVAATSPREPTPAASFEAAVPAQGESEGATSLPWGTFAMLLLVIALSFAIWGFYTRDREPSTPAKQPVASSTNPSGSTSPPPTSPSSDSQKPATEAQTTPPEVPAESSPHPPATAPGSAADSLGLAKAEPESSSTKAPVSTASLVTASFIVHIKARKDAWVSITADGRKLGEETLIGGAEKSIRAANQIIVRTGNSGALDLEFNGQKLATQGAYGEVKTLEFGPSGLEVTVSNSPKTETP
jgi:cytoskeleton protein RodZ